MSRLRAGLAGCCRPHQPPRGTPVRHHHRPAPICWTSNPCLGRSSRPVPTDHGEPAGHPELDVRTTSRPQRPPLMPVPRRGSHQRQESASHMDATIRGRYGAIFCTEATTTPTTIPAVDPPGTKFTARAQAESCLGPAPDFGTTTGLPAGGRNPRCRPGPVTAMGRRQPRNRRARPHRVAKRGESGCRPA